MITQLSADVVMLTAEDPTAKFELRYPIPEGMTYNSYVVFDEKIALLDTCDSKVADQWVAEIGAVLKGRTPDVLVVHHAEPDHSAIIPKVVEMFPNIRIVGSKICRKIVGQFLGKQYADRMEEVKEGDVVDLGKHRLKLVSAPQVHWPEVLVSYDESDGSLYSADAFGRFGPPDASYDWASGARRYYLNIVGKFGPYVQKLLAKVSQLDVREIRPLHGPVLSGDLSPYIALYDTWSKYRPETDGVAVIYDTLYGHTRMAAEHAAGMLRAAGKTVAEVDLSRTDESYAVEAAFRYSEMLVAAPTYETDLYPRVDAFLREIVKKGYQNRKVALVENGSWAPQAGKCMKKILEEAPGVEVLGVATVLSAMNDESRHAIDELVGRL